MICYYLQSITFKKNASKSWKASLLLFFPRIKIRKKYILLLLYILDSSLRQSKLNSWHYYRKGKQSKTIPVNLSEKIPTAVKSHFFMNKYMLRSSFLLRSRQSGSPSNYIARKQKSTTLYFIKTILENTNSSQSTNTTPTIPVTTHASALLSIPTVPPPGISSEEQHPIWQVRWKVRCSSVVPVFTLYVTLKDSGGRHTAEPSFSADRSC